MINGDSLRAVDAATWHAHFTKPLYDSYCFAQIPRLVCCLLDGDAGAGAAPALLGPLTGRYERVILFFVDAFGWRFFEPRCDEYPFLQRFVRDGVVSKLTSQFPSTTAAHVTAIHTGLPVGQSGVYEWFYYEPLLDAIIAPLLFSFAGDHGRNTLQHTTVAPAALYPPYTLYQSLEERGIKSFIFQHQDYTPSPYSDVVFRGAHVVPYYTLSEALTALEAIVQREREPTYYFVYYDKIDSICHRYGPTSPYVDAEVDTFLTMMDRLFDRKLAGKLANTLVMVTADHGQVAIDPATTIYLNQALPNITTYLKTNSARQLLVPAGSPRDMFLHVKEEHIDEAHDCLCEHLEGRAEVYRVPELIDRGFFGAPSPAFLGRVGDLVILPYQHESVWWYERDRFDQHYYGHHGGLTKEEMETILLARCV